MTGGRVSVAEGFKTMKPLISKFPELKQTVNWRVTHVALVGAVKENADAPLFLFEFAAWGRVDQRRLLAEAALLARQLADQLPELEEGQLPVVVFVQRAHELVDGRGIAGVLRGDDHRERERDRDRERKREREGGDPDH